MKMFVEPPAIYLHKQPVDFRKSINGLCVIVEEHMRLSAFSGALFVFCNRQRDKVKEALINYLRCQGVVKNQLKMLIYYL